LSAARRGDYAGAIASYTQLLRHNPTNAVDYNNRGLAYFHAKQFELALANYDTALALNPYLDSAYNNRANYYAAQGEFLEAILDYDIALDLNPGNVRAWINQGITFRDLQMYDRALENFESALKMEQWLGHIYAERGRTYHLRGDWNCAVADYQRAIAYLPALTPNPTNPSGRLRLQVEMWFDELLLPVFENTSCD
jgi:tetratricopeptide (TPR) repeat protein